MSLDEISLLYNKNPNFNFYYYKILNNLFHLDNNELIEHYNNLEKNNNLLTSIKDFYYKYPNFDIFFYKLIYTNLDFKSDIEYLIHYHNKGHKENLFYSLKNYEEKNKIDFIFLKNFYKIFTKLDYIEIIQYISKNNEDKYFYSDKDFIKEYPQFNLEIYKLFNKNIYFSNDLKYKSYWFHKGKFENQIASISDLKNYLDNEINLSLYKFIYNIEKDLDKNDIIFLFKNKENLIINVDSFLKYCDDFNFILFKIDFPHVKKYAKYKIIEFYILNINRIKYIYSEKMFYLKYPSFNIEHYKKFNNINENSNILNEYNQNECRNNLIISIDNFYHKYSNFNLFTYKNIYEIKNNKILDNDIDYIIDFMNNGNYNEEEKVDKFNFSLYKYFNKNIVKNFGNISIIHDYKINEREKCDLIFSFETFYKKYPTFNKELYKLLNNLSGYNEEDLIIHFIDIGIPLNLIYNEKMINDFNIKIYKELNKDLNNLDNNQLIIHWYKYGKYDRIYSKDTFYLKYPNYTHLKSESEIIDWMYNGVYKDIKTINERIIGRNIVNNIYEVLIDLFNPYPKEKLEKGISLIIRAKNEESNIKECIESVIDLVDEIIFVDNNSTDNTYNLMKKYENKYKKIKLYQYNINVSKVGIEHKNALKNNNKNTLGTFYNWCLSKATKYNVFKWDADFICIKSNFIQLVEKYNLRNRDDKFSIWFTGKTLFENNNKYYLNYNSFYDEFRIFSYKNNFCWYDGNTCEYTEPYLNSCISSKKYRFLHPLFYEIKRTSLDEFKERSSLIDNRDIKDFYILNNLKDNKKSDLIEINNNLINSSKKIILYTPSLSLGGGNQFIINIYTIYKSLGLNVIIFPMNQENIGSNKYKVILEEDIYNIKYFNISYIKKINPEFILFNSDIPFQLNDIEILSKVTKMFFVTHSDVAFSNSYIQKYHKYFNKIITVNNYSIIKISKLLKIDKSKFLKIINYSDIKKNEKILKNRTKNKKFGIVSRFSEDKNIPMLIYALKEIFKKYTDYKFYFIGTHNQSYDNYLIHLCKSNDIIKNISFEGYQTNIDKYYELFDFIVLPSVSEGCSYNIIEAMTLGIPVVTSNVGGNHELIINNNNGFIYDYTDIKNFEDKTLFILNYNEQLSKIGYFINDDQFKDNYKIKNIFDKTEVTVPFNVCCKKHLYENNNCIFCKNISIKKNIFNKNMNNIIDSIIKMIEMDQKIIDIIKKNNINFIEREFNQYKYSNQILGLLS